MQVEKIEMIERFAEPTDMDTAPYLSVCFVSNDSVWVQVGSEELPNWIEFDSIEEALKFISEKKNC